MLEQNIELFEKLSNYYYPKVYRKLDLIKVELIKIFEELVNNKAAENKLLSKNSVASTKYLSVIGRVKKKDSFREKLIRKNLGLTLTKELGLTSENFNSLKQNIENKIERFDDIIGLRFVCDLNADCDNAIKMLKDNLDFIHANNIVFLDGELENQPQKMKNGLTIYRIKGQFDDRYNFELQIKSKIDEAWGELDHFLFYKDYGFYPTKGIVQKTMNNVGHLLENIEALLFDLRNSKIDYKGNFKASLLHEKLELFFSKTLEKQFKFNYQLDKISNIIDTIIQTNHPDFLEGEKELELDFKILKFNKPDGYESYFIARDSFFEIQVLESISCFLWEKDNKKELKQADYGSFISELIQDIYKTIENVIIKEKQLVNYDFDKLWNNINILTTYEADVSIWIAPEKHIGFLELKIVIDESYNELFEEKIENEQYSENDIECLLRLIMACHFEGNLKLAIDNECSANISDIIFDLKAHFKSIKNPDKKETKINNYLNSISNKLS